MALPKFAPPTRPEDISDRGDMRLYADPLKVYPMRVHGPVRTIKWAVLVVCLGIYYILPWLRWDRGPGRPDQAFLLDLARERLFILNWEFWPQEAPFLAGVLILAAFGLFMVTSLFGRVWCGFTCPQTVWTDLFMWVERRIEGDRNARIKLDSQPWTFNKSWRKSLKHIIWLGVAFWTGGAWIMYFADAPTVTVEFWHGTAPIPVYVMTALFTATTYLLAGWAREQVCTYMCPWPRFQAAMLDAQTLTISYEAHRGEPRGKKAKGVEDSSIGDCVDCHACVNVCPTGIDIRDGQQLECIGCGLCVDACNNIMAKLDRPANLIMWDTLHNQTAKAKGQPPKPIKFIRPRTLIYTTAVIVGLSVMSWSLWTLPSIGISVQRDRAPLFVKLSDGSVRNGYTISLLNKRAHDMPLLLSVSGLHDASLEITDGTEIHGNPITLNTLGDAVTDVRVLLHGPKGSHGVTPIQFTVIAANNGEQATYTSSFRAPE